MTPTIAVPVDTLLNLAVLSKTAGTTRTIVFLICFAILLSSAPAVLVETRPTAAADIVLTFALKKNKRILPKVRRPPIPRPHVETPRPKRKPKYKHPFDSDHPT